MKRGAKRAPDANAPEITPLGASCPAMPSLSNEKDVSE